MAAGEYVSVHSQADTEHADLNTSAQNSEQATRASMRSWQRSTLVAAWIPRSRNKSLTS